VIPIPGSKRARYLEANVSAATLELEPADIEALDGLVGEGGGAVGDRLPRRARA
jgi:aryl-alcohol dehydrogenase-like predicted oxidoreductase